MSGSHAPGTIQDWLAVATKVALRPGLQGGWQRATRCYARPMAGWREDSYDTYEEPYAPYARAGAYERADEDGRQPRITPFRFGAAVALVGSLLLTAYAFFVERTALQIPIMISGLAVLGATLAVLAFSGALRATHAAESGRSASAFWSALLGGLCALGAAGALGSAVVFTLIWVSAR